MLQLTRNYLNYGTVVEMYEKRLNDQIILQEKFLKINWQNLPLNDGKECISRKM